LEDQEVLEVLEVLGGVVYLEGLHLLSEHSASRDSEVEEESSVQN